MVIAALFNMKDLVQALLVQLFSDSFLTLLLHPLLPLAWGPWTPWYTDWTLNGIITGVVWAGIAFGLAYVIGELIVILGAFGIVADLLGWLSGFWFQLMIAEFIGEVFCIICFQWRLRYDPQMELFQEQYRFALYNSLTHVYFWFGQPLSYVHG